MELFLKRIRSKSFRDESEEKIASQNFFEFCFTVQFSSLAIFRRQTIVSLWQQCFNCLRQKSKIKCNRISGLSFLSQFLTISLQREKDFLTGYVFPKWTRFDKLSLWSYATEPLPHYFNETRNFNDLKYLIDEEAQVSIEVCCCKIQCLDNKRPKFVQHFQFFISRFSIFVECCSVCECVR